MPQRNHPLRGQKQIPITRLRDEAFIMRERGSGTRQAVETLFERFEVEVRVRLELGSNEAIKQAVVGGLGLSILSRHSLALEGAQGPLVILDVEGFPIQKHWYVIYPSGKQLSIVAQTFLDYLLTEGRESAQNFVNIV
jgi:DNA-binding transcriptional LysR family regulator